MSHILITGVNGFVGHHLSHELLAAGYEVTGVGGPQFSSDNLPEALHYIPLDLTNTEAVKSLDFSQYQGVIHLAGLAAVGPSFDQPLLYLTGNIGMQVNLFEAALAQKTQPRFVIISSGNLYDPHAALPLTEDSSVIPSNPYAVSKLGQEQMAEYYSSRGFEVVVARPFNHIGPGQNLGFIVPDLTQQVVAFENADLDKITVGNLDAKRDYTDVRDIARAYRLLLEKGKSGQIYNVCSGSSRSGHEILNTILAATDVHPEVVQDPAKMRPSDTPDIYGSHAKLTADTSWQPEIPLETTITDVVADWRARN